VLSSFAFNFNLRRYNAGAGAGAGAGAAGAEEEDVTRCRCRPGRCLGCLCVTFNSQCTPACGCGADCANGNDAGAPGGAGLGGAGGEGGEGGQGLTLVHILAQPTPFWSHLAVSPCLTDSRKFMHPTYPTKCTYVEPKSGRV